MRKSFSNKTTRNKHYSRDRIHARASTYIILSVWTVTNRATRLACRSDDAPCPCAVAGDDLNGGGSWSRRCRVQRGACSCACSTCMYMCMRCSPHAYPFCFSSTLSLSYTPVLPWTTGPYCYRQYYRTDCACRDSKIAHKFIKEDCLSR